MPDVFTPNGDGVNDLLRVYSPDEDHGILKSFTVFNRWGDIVYRIEDVLLPNNSIGWDGKVRYQFLDTGIYLWSAIVEFPFAGEEIQTGSTALIYQKE